jgi:integrase
MNNSAWQRARQQAGLQQVRVHDLKHTFGRRLAAGAPLETRKVLLGHKSGDITTHYSAPEIAELLEAANRVAETRVRTLLRVIA